jgi:hypothetical protein
MFQITMLRTILVAVATAATAIGIAFATPPAPPPAPNNVPATLRNDPMTISMSNFGRKALQKPWTLSVNSAGQAELTVGWPSNARRKQFTVPAENLTALRTALANERFFELQNQYGQQVFDGGWDTLTITVGDQTKSIRLDFLGNWIHSDPAKLRDPARALRVTTLIRGWFDDPEAFDSRPYDKLAIDAAK